MESEQRLIVCCNYRAHSNEEKGQAIALYEKDKNTSKLTKINTDKYFSDPDDCEVHIIPNYNNEHDYAYLQNNFDNRLYLIQCVENKNIEDDSNFSKNKSNLFRIEPVEPKSVCEVVTSRLPNEAFPEIIVNSIPLSRHIFIQDDEFTYGPFEYGVSIEEESSQFKISLIKPNDTKYLGNHSPRKLSTLKFHNDVLNPYIDSFEFPNKIIDKHSFKHKFISNVQELKNIDCKQINYGFMDELAKAVGTIVKETNTKGITRNQITMLLTRIKNKRGSFNFDIDYVFKQLNESTKFEKTIAEAKQDLRNLVLEQALNENNEELKKHFLSVLKSDETTTDEVKKAIRLEQEDLMAELEKLHSDLSSANSDLLTITQEIKEAKDKKTEIDKDKEESVFEQLRQQQTELNNSIHELENKKFSIQEKYKDVFQYDTLKKQLEELEEEIRFQKRLYLEKIDEVREKEQEVLAQKEELKELTEKSAEHYKKELLSVKNSIDVLTQIDNGPTIVNFSCINESELIEIGANNSLFDYLKYIQIALSEHNRNISIEHVINYLVCIDTSFITILSGLPGTGKTSLISILSEHVLKARFNNIQVGRGWSSERDLLGYFNPITNSYISSSSGMYEFLNGLENDKRVNIVLLDEANLSPIEHYWSKFMGLTDSFEGQKLSITNSETIKLTNNLRFIATINNDMTTEPLSPRLIDRAPCIRLDIYNQKDEGNKTGLDTINEDDLETIKNKFSSSAVCYSIFQNAINNCKPDLEKLESMIDIIDQIKELLTCDGVENERFGARVHLSERRYQLIRKYLEQSLGLYKDFCENTVKWIEVDNSSYFLDFTIAQFILPLITGHGKSFKNRITHINNLFVTIQQTHNYELPISQELVTRMLNQGEEDLDTYDFMSVR